MGANASHEPLGPDSTRGNSKPHSSANVFSPYGRASIRKSLRRRKEKRNQKENYKEDGRRESDEKVEGPSEAHVRKMDKLRKSFRESFRKKKDVHIPESSKPHLWQSDESSVRAGTCSFPVKYLGCVEVYESRGMQVCEEALKVLRNSRRRPIRGILYVSGDGLRVVDDDTKGLIVDQTIEKVSFCAPDRNHERGFSYICRDGTTRRWMCHGFVAVKETGERLSHAVGCAFAACLERKQRRDKECGVTMTFDKNTSTFTRMGSFRQMTVTERLSDPQECKPIDPVPVKKVENPHAIARPHATPQLLQRQGSFRVFNQLSQSSPFKRQLSLRLSDLPSNIERSRSLSLDNSSSIEDSANVLNNNTTYVPPTEPLSPTAVPPHIQRNRLHSLPIAVNMTPIPEGSPVVDHKTDAVSAMCQQVSAGLSLLSSFTDPFGPSSAEEQTFRSTSPFATTAETVSSPMIPYNSSLVSESYAPSVNNSGSTSSNAGLSKGEEWLAQLNTQPVSLDSDVFSEKPLEIITPSVTSLHKRAPPLSQLRSTSLGSAPSSGNTPDRVFSTSFSSRLTNGNSPVLSPATTIPTSKPSRSTGNDPFDAEWASLASRSHNPNNPFLTSAVTKTFEIQM